MEQKEKQSNATFINQMRTQRPTPDPTFAATLRRNLLHRAQAPRQQSVFVGHTQFVSLAFATLLLVGILSLAIYPSARAWAQDVITLVLQSFHITHEPSHAERAWENFVQNPHVPTADERLAELSVEQAQAAVDFPLRLPTVIPDYYQFFAAYVHQDLVYQSDNPQVTIMYQGILKRSLQLSQVRVAGPIDFPIGEGAAQAININGRPAIAVEQMMNGVIISLSEQGDEVLDYAKQHSNGLLWEDEDILYQLWSNSLTLEELVQIAESIE